ncbi:hypothetical protein HDU98_012297 [Podochytrium sp. JEL0797]|nr:hypothetical protein HDU98_012297 [Podochytrium sp. JEL0797]
MESLWTELNAALPSPIRMKDILTSSSMTTRDDRLKEARKNVDRCNRVLAKDRNDLEDKERKLMNQIRQFASKGDLVKARIAARQISHYRTASDRNYESAAIIQTRAQLMVSNHKINQAKIEALKGSRYADMYDTIESVSARELKYAHMMGVQEEMELIMNEGMDDVYETAEELIKKRDYFDLETEAILKQALDPKQYVGRTYTLPEATLAQQQQNQKFTIHFKIYDPSSASKHANTTGDSSGTLNASAAGQQSLTDCFPNTPDTNPSHGRAAANGSTDFDVSPLSSPRVSSSRSDERAASSSKRSPGGGVGASLKIPTLDLSIDMLKRLMTRDAYLMNQLDLKTTKKSMYDVVLGSCKGFKVGKVGDGGVFEEFDFVKSLKECGVVGGGVVWVVVE